MIKNPEIDAVLKNFHELQREAGQFLLCGEAEKASSTLQKARDILLPFREYFVEELMSTASCLAAIYEQIGEASEAEFFFAEAANMSHEVRSQSTSAGMLDSH